jgi:flagellar hook-associated protein 1 FlgK
MVTETMLNNHNTTADEIYVDRDGVMGVDLNDEAMNMMQFQKAYSASCRLMTTFDTMLDKLINGTAI